MIALYKHTVCLASKPAEIKSKFVLLLFWRCLSFFMLHEIPCLWVCAISSVFTYFLRHFDNVFINKKFIRFLTLVVMKKDIHF